MVSRPAWTLIQRIQTRHNGTSTIAAEALMRNAGYTSALPVGPGPDQMR
jgi:hypothetical protein